MQVKAIVMFLLAALPAVALANGTPPAPEHAQPQVQQQGQDQAQAQRQGQQQTAAAAATAAAQGGASSSTSTASNAGNRQDITFRDRLQTPAVTAPSVYTPNPCAIGWSLGAGAPGAGLSGGRTKIDPRCQAALEERAKTQELRANIALTAQLNKALALKAACQLPGIREVASAEDCALPPPVVEPPATATQCTKTLRQCARK